MKKILIATKNKGKLEDIKQIFKNSEFEFISLLDLSDAPEIDESGNSFEENAKIKAFACYEKYKIISIGDDSGLSVDQLNGRPGIYSARFASENANDEENNLKLLNELSSYEKPHIAQFICVASLFDGKNFYSAQGEIKGQIINEIRGKNGFGYDPLFIPDGFNKTFGELSIEEKNLYSHRSKAFRSLKTIIEKIL